MRESSVYRSNGRATAVARMSFWFRLLIGGIVSLAGFTVGLNRANKPSAEFWVPLGSVVTAALVVVSFGPAIQTAIGEYGERRKRKAAERTNKLQELLAGGLITLVDTAHTDWRSTALQVFVVSRRNWLWKAQTRTAKLRLVHVQPSGISWSKGKGLIGRCWESGVPVARNLSEHFAPYLHLSESEWQALPLSFDKYGLSYREFKKVGDKYGLIVAFPLTDSGDRYIGCITADMPPEYSSGVSEAEVRRTLAALAPSISAVITAGTDK